ncbi:MAG: metal-dependent hydrolase [Desulfovibrionaceae bacterium]|nr:metal-dependent hydrolase [Desulfovibrionaceae bacterium]
MDSVTHLAAGALTPLAFSRAPRMWPLVFFGITAGILPDIDILAGSSAHAMFSIHRGLTHSILSISTAALLLALSFKFFLSNLHVKNDAVRVVDGLAVIARPDDWSLGQIFLVALLGLGLHLYLDCMTSFGTQIFWPFSNYRVAVPALFIVDPLLTIPLLIILFYCLRNFKSRAKLAAQVTWARYAIFWALLYPLICLGIHEGLSRKFNRDYTEVGTAAEKITLTPVLFSPFYWKAVAENSEEYRMQWVATHKFSTRPHFDPPAYSKVPPRLWQRLAEVLPIFGEYREFAHFPTLESTINPQGLKELTFKDLRYIYSLPNFLKECLGTDDGLFHLQARLGKDNRVYAWRYLGWESTIRDTAWEDLHPAPILPE